ncbi:hypothetical protein [Hyphomicrobium sp. CS1GBMeth3]|uniref:hypothetical protein n=1 Tax=Hyphomicrobium sp. CS1GBMeth3 TaxID=1892845 RepID=UPI000930AE18|nr:hypothetical protein [Hyphomicrobium sp. CS1GBMeth3]
MRASISTACLTAALVLAAALPLSRAASAEDLYDDDYVNPSYDTAYDDRYPDNGEPRRAERYDEPYDDGGETLPGSVKDGYPVPVPPPEANAPPPPPRYAERPPVRVERYEEACLGRWEIRRELRRDGWRDLRPEGGDGNIVHMRARRAGTGHPFDLRVDRCSGEVLAARPFYRGVAYRDWRWVK